MSNDFTKNQSWISTFFWPIFGLILAFWNFALQAADIDPQVEEEIGIYGESQVIISLYDPVAIDAPDEKRVKAVKTVQDNVLKRLLKGKFRKKHQYHYVPALAATIDREILETLRTDSQVESVRVDTPQTITLAESKPLIKADQVNNLTPTPYTGTNIYVAVIDTGIDTDHPDLIDDLVAQKCFTNSACPPNSTSESDSAEDDQGHGTHVSGIITAKGVVAPAGVAPNAKIIAVKVLDSSGNGRTSDTIAALDWLRNNLTIYPVKIVNLSLGGGLYYSVCDYSNPSYANAIKLLAAQGVTIFAASGNEASPIKISSPACLSNTIAVGNTYKMNYASYTWGSSTCTDDQSRAAIDKVACSSNSNVSLLDILAPGSRITSSGKGGGIANMGGTSMATPTAAGVAALMLEANPALASTDILAIMKSTGIPVVDSRNGGIFQRINALAATKTVIPPLPPLNLSATMLSATEIRLNWTDNSDNENFFSIFRNDLLTQVGGNPAGTGEVEYLDINLTCGTTYNYIVKATNVYGGDSSETTIVVTTLPCTAGYHSTPAGGNEITFNAVVNTSAIQTLNVQETGTTALQISAIVLSGNNPDKFTVSPTSLTIAEGDPAQDITLECDSSEVGIYTATLTIYHNAVINPVTYNLSCTINPAIAGYDSTPTAGSTINLTTITASISPKQIITVQETGTATLEAAIELGGTHPGKFIVSPLNFNIADGANNQSINIQCVSGESGIYTATLIIHHNASDNPATYDLSCIVIPPPKAGYGSMPAAGSTVQLTTITPANIVVKEVGNTTLNITSITLYGNSSKFTVITPTNFSIADDGPNQVVTVQCHGNIPGIYQTTLIIKHSASIIPAIYYLSCRITPTPVPKYSSLPSNGRTITFYTRRGINVNNSLKIEEVGTATLTISSIIFKGTYSSKFKLLTPTNFSILDGGIPQTVTFQCNANEIGTYGVTLIVHHNATNSPATYNLRCVVGQK